MKVQKAIQNSENGVVRGHSRSLEIAPFDRVHMSSYKCFIVTIPCLAPFLRYSEMLVENCQFEPTPHQFGVP